MYVKVWVDCPYLKRRQTKVEWVETRFADFSRLLVYNFGKSLGIPTIEGIDRLNDRPIPYAEWMERLWRNEWSNHPASHVMDSEGNDTGLRVAS